MNGMKGEYGMKICMYSVDEVFKNTTGGVRRFAELMNVLIARGHDVTLYSADSLDKIRTNGCEGECIYNCAKKKEISRICSLIKRGGYERVIVFDVKAATPLVLNGISNIYLFLRQDFYLYRKIMLQDKNANSLYSSAFLKMVCLSEHICLKKAKKIVVQCQFDLNGLVSRHPALKSNILSKTTIQINNINPSWVKASQDKEVSYSNKIYDVVFVGNFKDSRKGHDVLIPALQQLVDEGVNLRAVVIGDGVQLQQYRDICKNYPNIEFMGRLDNPMPVIRNSKLMVVPSYVDSCPNTVMEALYNYVPVIGANKSGIPEILNNPEWLFEMDIPSLKKAIKKGLEPETNKRILASQKIRRSQLMFDWGFRMAEIVESK